MARSWFFTEDIRLPFAEFPGRHLLQRSNFILYIHGDPLWLSEPLTLKTRHTEPRFAENLKAVAAAFASFVGCVRFVATDQTAVTAHATRENGGQLREPFCRVQFGSG